MVLTATTMILAATAVAPATAVPGGLRYYRWLDCPAGTSNAARIDSMWTDVDYMGRTLVSFVGEVFPCASPTLDEEVWALAAYSSNSASGKAHPYRFGNLYNGHYYGTRGIGPAVQAVCVIADETTRLACVSISWVDTDGVLLPVVEGPLPVDSPRVAAPAVTNMSVYPDPIGPGCGLCP
ncbi:hypothetical protein [Catellatospora sichuanensis]|uniref:hypothetical protein n=1 Tax=Catellatospora sichuanensis TaxID=1969805 RepID=UPI0011826AC2|nr:hypothetical protein [Catellatospora sichuanensis]